MVFFKRPRRRLKSEKAELRLQRRRRGLTSPPLIGIEVNPGPKRKASRKGAKTPLKTKKKPKLQPEDINALIARWEAGESKESIIASSPYHKKTVSRWIGRHQSTGNAKRNFKSDQREDSKESEKVNPPLKEEKLAKSPYEQLTDFEKGEVIMAQEMGASIHWIAERLQRDRQAIKDWVKRRSKTESCRRLEGSGRSKVTLPGDDRYLKILSLNDPWLTAVEMVPMLQGDDGKSKASVRTIRNRLIEFGLHARSPRKKPLLNRTNINARLAWAKKYQAWTIDQWKRVLWSDESGFQLFNSGRRYCRRRENEDLGPNKTVKTVKHGGGKIMVWGCFHYNGVGVLKTIEGKMDAEKYKQILIHQAMPNIKALIEGETDYVAWVFQHDNDPKHKAHIVTDYLENKQEELGMKVLDWPSQSPDLNPIEHIWGYIKRKLKERVVKPQNLDQLYGHIQEEWGQIPQRVLNNLVESIPRRIQAVIKAKGHSTKY